MDNKYKVIEEERLNDITGLYTLIDLNSKREFSCIMEKYPNHESNLLTDDTANVFDIAEALFQEDLDLYHYLPFGFITPNIEREYENYYPGKSRCIYTDEEYKEAYEIEEKRIAKLEKNAKKLVR